MNNFIIIFSIDNHFVFGQLMTRSNKSKIFFSEIPIDQKKP